MTAQENKSPLLSIITVCLNAPNLEETCKSIVNQTFQDFEWIVIDGGSNAETLAIFEKYRYRMNYFVSEKDSGIYDAMNKGIKVSTGKWLNFMNGGDAFYTSDTLKNISHDLNIDNDNDVIYGKSLFYKDNKRFVFDAPDKIDIDYLYHSTIPHQASFIRKSIFNEIGMYNINYNSGDHILWIILSRHKKKFHKINDIINIQDRSIGSASLQFDKVRIELKMIRKNYFTYEEQQYGNYVNEKLYIDFINKKRSSLQNKYLSK